MSKASAGGRVKLPVRKIASVSVAVESRAKPYSWGSPRYWMRHSGMCASLPSSSTIAVSRKDLESQITDFTISHNRTARPYRWRYDAEAEHARYLVRHPQPTRDALAEAA